MWPGCPWLPSHQEHVVLWLSSCLECGVALFTLTGIATRKAGYSERLSAQTYFREIVVVTSML